MKKFVVIFPLFLSLFLCCCAPAEKVYEEFSRFEATDEELKLLSEGKLKIKYDRSQFDNSLEYYKYLLSEYLTAGSNLAKSWGTVLIPISWAIAFILFALAKKSINIRKIALFVFGIGIPAILALLIYGSAILADMLGV